VLELSDSQARLCKLCFDFRPCSAARAGHGGGASELSRRKRAETRLGRRNSRAQSPRSILVPAGSVERPARHQASGAAAQTFRARSTHELLSHGRTSARATTLSTTDERRREAHVVQRREVDDEDLSAEKRERKERPGLRLEQGEAKEICEVGATRKEDGERVREGVVTTGTRD